MRCMRTLLRFWIDSWRTSDAHISLSIGGIHCIDRKKVVALYPERYVITLNMKLSPSPLKTMWASVSPDSVSSPKPPPT